MATIFEESNNSLDDAEHQIEELEAERDKQLEPDVEMRAVRALAEKAIEEEL